jgi:hypothetical protein
MPAKNAKDLQNWNNENPDKKHMFDIQQKTTK